MKQSLLASSILALILLIAIIIIIHHHAVVGAASESDQDEHGEADQHNGGGASSGYSTVKKGLLLAGLLASGAAFGTVHGQSTAQQFGAVQPPSYHYHHYQQPLVQPQSSQTTNIEQQFDVLQQDQTHKTRAKPSKRRNKHLKSSNIAQMEKTNGQEIARRQLAQKDEETNIDRRRQGHHCTLSAKNSQINPRCYPQPTRGNVVDDYFGTKVPDPYRALENATAPQTQQFVNQLNAMTEPFLAASHAAKQLKEKFEQMFFYEKFGVISKHGESYYYTHNNGSQNQDVIWKTESPETRGNVFLDPNTFSTDGTTAISNKEWTRDGTIMAFSVMMRGSDDETVKFISSNGVMLDDQIPLAQYSQLAWMPDNSGVFYSKFPDANDADQYQYHSLYFHSLNSKSDDLLVVQRKDDPDIQIVADVSADGHYVFVGQYPGSDDSVNELYYFDLRAANNKIAGPLKLQPMFNLMDASYEVVDSDEHSALILTNHNAPFYKLVRVQLNGVPNQNSTWEVVIEEDRAGRRRLEQVDPVAGQKLLARYLENVQHTLYVHDLSDGIKKQTVTKLQLDIGSIADTYAHKNDTKVFVAFESFLVPTIVYQADLGPGSPMALKEVHRSIVQGLERDEFEVNQVFYKSKDNRTDIPMHIIHKKGMPLDGNRGTLLYGYGAMNYATLPYFSPKRLMMVKHFDGVSATANIRGGGEYGDEWHEQGELANKQNSFDDFIAAAEFLIHNNYTNSKKLAIEGESAGGLLTAVCAQQRRDLFGAVIIWNGVLDMLRFNKFTIGEAFEPEYGDPSKKKDFQVLYSYSPLHQLSLKKDNPWPSTLLLTADHDDRVVPMHTLKYTAQLHHLLANEARGCRGSCTSNPVLARIDTNAGHGDVGMSNSKQVADLTAVYSFMQRVLGLNWTN